MKQLAFLIVGVNIGAVDGCDTGNDGCDISNDDGCLDGDDAGCDDGLVVGGDDDGFEQVQVKEV